MSEQIEPGLYVWREHFDRFPDAATDYGAWLALKEHCIKVTSVNGRTQYHYVSWEMPVYFWLTDEAAINDAARQLVPFPPEPPRLAQEQAVDQKVSWKVGVIIRVPAPAGGYRVWRVIGVFLGGENQEGVIELDTLDRKENTQGRMCVPVDFLDAAMRSAAVSVME